MKKRVTTYEPDNSLKKGYLSIFREIFEDFKENKWLTYQLFRRDFLVIYKQSFIGIFWVFILPFVSVGTFILLNQSGVLIIGDINTPYPVYALFGMAFWQLFATGLIAGSNSLVKAGPMIVKINFSKKSLVIASQGQSIVSFLIQFLLAFLLLLIYGVKPHISIFLVPILILPIILLSLGLSFVLSLLNGVMRDIGNLLSVLVTFLMFLTPVLYERPIKGVLADITSLNPLYYLISVPRQGILTGTYLEINGFLISGIISIIIFMAFLIVFHLTETRVVERI